MDPVQLASELPPVPPLCDHASCGGCWKGYPQSRFPNWTEAQVSRSKIANAIANYGRSADPCVIYRADVLANGIFKNVPSVVATDKDLDGTWNTVIRTIVRPLHRTVEFHVVCDIAAWTWTSVSKFLCLDYWSCYLWSSDRKIFELERCSSRIYLDPSFKCLEQGGMLSRSNIWSKFNFQVICIGTFDSYNIEPFYFSSSLNWIPSRFQEDIQDGKGDRKPVS